MKELTFGAFVTLFPDVCFPAIVWPDPEETMPQHTIADALGISLSPLRPALQTTLMSSLPVYSVVFYFTSRGTSGLFQLALPF